MNRPVGALVFMGACVFGTLHAAGGAAPARIDPALLASLEADPQLHACGCLRSAAWLNESYPRITVDAVRWRKLSGPARTRLCARALKIAEATYLTESAATDQYEQIFFVDGHGKTLSTFEPSSR